MATATTPELPGPRAPRPIQTAVAFSKPEWARKRMRSTYGPIFRTHDLIGGRVVHIADRELVEEMFKWKPAEYIVGEPREVMEPAVGPRSLLLLDGQRHLRMRKLMLPPFHGEAIARFETEIAEIADRHIGGLREGETVRARAIGQAITLEVIIRAVFGITDRDRVAELSRLLPPLSAPTPLALLVQRDLGPRSPWGRFLRARDRVDEMLYAEIADRRSRDGGDGHDILTLLMAATDERGEPLSDAELRDELITLLLAGHETTANSIGWAFERLVRTPRAMSALRRSLEDDGDPGYLDAVVKETLRVRPVVSEVFRAPTEPVELGGHRFEPGEQLAAAILLIQLDPAIYGADAEEFRPERFLAGAPEPYSWIPFGGGVRRCIGAAFAELEMRVVIERLVRRAQVGPVRSRPEAARFRGVTLLPGRGGEIRVERLLA